MDGGGIFLSYRRDDTAGEAGRLAEHLARRFGQDHVFIDIDTIAPGTDFTTELERALVGTTVVLVIIGRRWLTAADAQGRRRLDVSDDFVRREILTALQRGTRLIPVLVQNATMPTAADLPDALAPLASRQAIAIQHEEFSADTQRLGDAIAPLLERNGTRAKLSRAVVAAIASVALLAVVFLGWRWQQSTTAAEATARAAEQAEATRQARQQEVDDLVGVADAQRERGQLSDALTTLERAVSLDADISRAKALEEDVAMQWIRGLAVESGQRFADAMKTPLAVLDRAAPFASGPRQGDLLAHLGWATYLRWRDGERSLDPPATYRKALAVDSANPYANAMLGHWTISYDDPNDLEQARRLFRTAIDSGRATDVVRGLQLSALRNAGSVANRLETIRVLDEMRRRDERLRPRDVSDAWSIYYFALNDNGALTSAALLAVLPPTEHLLTLQWAFDEYARSEKSRLLQMRYYTARLLAEAGNVMAARDALQALRTDLASSPGSLRDAVDRALEASTAPPRQQPRLPPIRRP